MGRVHQRPVPPRARAKWMGMTTNTLCETLRRDLLPRPPQSRGS
jgi:hypothetical protein